MSRVEPATGVVLLAVAAAVGAASLAPRAPQARASELRTQGARPAPSSMPGQVAGDWPPDFRLSEGHEAGDAPALVARPPATRLSQADASAVLDRLPPHVAEARVEPFALREPSLPPPRTGRTERTPFPPAQGEAARPDVAAPGPLSVLRRMPEGDVPLAPHLSLTFSQPMVALDSHAALALADVPVRLEPQPPGEWRWIGTRTLVFEPEGRFPMASAFRATVPAGTRSATGSTLARGESWSFTTTAPRLVAHHPEGGPVRRDTLLFAAFDQRIDKAAVLAAMTLRAGGGAPLALRLATDAEVQGDATVSRMARAAEPERWIAFRAEAALPPDTALEVRAGPDVPSAEGPRRSAAAERWGFRTYGPFRVRRSECGWNGRCSPFDPWRIELTNPIDAKTLRKDVVRVEPELAGLKVESWGDTLAIRGLPRGRSSYRVTLASTLRDIFGQELEPGGELAFAVGAAPPTLHAQGGDFIVLDPAGGPVLPVYSTGHAALRVEAFAVTPDDWPAWHAYRQKDWRNEAATPPGRRVISTTLRVANEADALVESRIDLRPALAGGLGQLVVVVRPAATPRDRPPQAVRAWVQATRIGLDAFADGETLLAWASDLVSGHATGDVELSLGPARGRTRENGLARLALGAAPAALLVARRGADVAILPQQASWWSEGAGWRRSAQGETLRFFVFDDRRLYRPGEDVRVKGWLRRIGAGPRGDVEPLPAVLRGVAWTLRDSQGNESAKGRAAIGPTGGFDVAFALPRTFNLGSASLQLEAEATDLPGRGHVHGFEVQEFRRPEFEVKADATAGPHVAGGAATVSVRAAYYAGGALPGAEVTWQVAAQAAFYRPPNRDDFVFGTFVPWWLPGPVEHAPARSEAFAARTDGTGVHRLRIDFESNDPPRPRLVTAEATVMDVNRQAWTASAPLLVHAALRYVGLRPERPFVQKGEDIALDVIATDLDGGAVAGSPVSLRAERLEWEQVEGEWRETPQDREERTLVSGSEPVRARFRAQQGGVWRVLARVSDTEGRENETELRVWVAGGRVPPRRDLEQETVTLVPDRKEYRAGDVARLLVVAPFAPAGGVLTLRRSGLLREERFEISSGSHTLEVPIEEAFTPNVHVQVDLVGQAPRDGAWAGAAQATPMRPAFASGTLDLPVPPASRTLALQVTPREPALEPGAETVLDLALRDASGQPIADGEAAVVVVDEAVLALTGYRLPDPLDVFYARRGADVSDHRLRSHVLLAAPDALRAPIDAPGEGGFAPEALSMERALPAAAAPMQRTGKGLTDQATAAAPIRARTDFAALALFAASVRLDSDGRARVPVRLPDSLTRYRVMAVAASGARSFGSGEATLVARLPLMVRPSPPRFLNFGDRFELPVVVQNQTAREMTVDVAVRASNAALTDGDGRRVVVAANDRAEVRFPMAAARAGTARIQVGAVSGAAADAAELELPVWTPATTETFATYGQLDDGVVVQPLRAPEGARPELGGLEVTTSSTALQALTDAVLYLVAYPFECSEQLSSRVLAVAALRDVLTAFEAEGLPKPDALRTAVARDLERLRALQNDDGGFGFWRRGERSWPYVSIHVAHALVRARAKGFGVPDDTLQKSQRYLREIDRHMPREYGLDVRRTLQAYALAVRALAGDADPARARALVREATASGLSFEALGFVLPLLSKDAASRAEVAAIRLRIANGVSETAAAAHFAVSYGDGAHLLLHSDRRADAILLEALILDQPASDLIPKLVEGLLAHRTAGRWSSTQENVFVLLALDRYFQAYEKATPDFVARAWLGERFAGSHAFRGRTTERQHIQIPMAALYEASGASEVLLAKQGAGRLYYRLGLRYAPQSLVLAPLDRGFTVERAYEGVDSAADVKRDADGTWRIRAGARVRVRLTMVAPARRYHVALVDPLPAGLEALNPALAVSGSLPGDDGSEIVPLAATGLGGPGHPGQWWWWSRTWFDHQNLRDERVEAFAALLWEGVHSYRYVARATTPGTFVVPPPKAEEMYSPESFGRGGSDRVVVE
jgi:uncharacterized protein YfaS (alpha-2-macroglobulin family)